MITEIPALFKMLTWKQQKDNLKARFPKLTKDDLNFDERKKYEMLNKLQLKLGMTPNELEVIALA